MGPPAGQHSAGTAQIPAGAQGRRARGGHPAPGVCRALRSARPCLFAKPRVPVEIINDIDGQVVNFFRMLRDHPGALARACQLTPYARTEYDADALAAMHGSASWSKARRFWARCLPELQQRLRGPPRRGGPLGAVRRMATAPRSGSPAQREPTAAPAPRHATAGHLEQPAPGRRRTVPAHHLQPRSDPKPRPASLTDHAADQELRRAGEPAGPVRYAERPVTGAARGRPRDYSSPRAAITRDLPHTQQATGAPCTVIPTTGDATAQLPGCRRAASSRLRRPRIAVNCR